MRIDYLGSIEALRRKLRAVSALVEDPAATEHEKANAKVMRQRLLRRLRQAGAPAGDWTDIAFRIGRWTKDSTSATAPAAPKGDWTDNAHRLGKALRRGYKKWLSD